MFSSESRLIFCFHIGIIDRLELAIICDVFDERLYLPKPGFNPFQIFTGTGIGAVNVLNLFLKIGILQEIVFSKIVERFRSFFEIVDLRPVFISLAFLRFDAVLNVDDKRYTFARGLRLALAGIASLNALLDALFGIVLTDGFCTSETLLAFGSEGDVLAGFDFISGILHQFQELIIVLCRDDISVNGLL